MDSQRIRTRYLRRAALAGLAALLLFGFVMMPAADHRDGPVFGPPGVNGPGGVTISRRDINDIHVFRSPTNPNNTVFVFDISPFSTVNTPAVFDHRITIDINIINQNLLQATDDLKLRINFTPPDSNGVQNVTLRGLPAATFSPPSFTNPNPNPILAQGRTGVNLPIRVGGQFRAAEHDDPFFFDAAGFGTLISTGAGFPRAPGTAVNFFGPDVNTLCLIVEIPSRFLVRPGSNLIGVWVSHTFKGNQIDRMGRPSISAVAIPPLPRGGAAPNFNIGGGPERNRQERRNAFMAGHPRNDRRDFKDDVIAVLTNFYGQSAERAEVVANLFLPDILVHDVTSTAGFGTILPGGFLGNGRRLRDDVIDEIVKILLNNPAAGDNVADDNPGAADAGPTSPIQPNFPYIGARNRNPGGLPRQGQPALGQ